MVSTWNSLCHLSLSSAAFSASSSFSRAVASLSWARSSSSSTSWILRFNDATSPSAWHTNTTGQRWEVGHKQTRRQPLFWIVLCAVCVKARILSRIPWTYFYSLWRAITLLSRFHFASSLKGPVIINILDYDLWTLHTWPKFCYFYIWTNRSKNYTLLHYTDILWNHTTD